MNLLAHAYLSFGQPELLVGNMISDYVKGKKQYDYPLGIQQGIRLHRAIDAFTDCHAATARGKAIFKPAVGLYAGAFMDVVYDHFLALDSRIMDEAGWQDFSVSVYASLVDHHSFLPEKFARMLPYMRTQDWLYNYRFTWGIEKSFGGLVRRAAYLTDSTPAYELFLANLPLLADCYYEFFPAVKKMAELEWRNLQNL
jgi:acyl carrier protein phosphodiesterase